jgi:hypothetical protein
MSSAASAQISPASPGAFPLWWLAKRAFRRLGVAVPWTLGAILAGFLIALPPFPEAAALYFWWTHLGLGALGVSMGRLIAHPGGGALFAQSPRSPLSWWAGALAVLFLAAGAWLALALTALPLALEDDAGRVFIGANALAALIGFAAGSAAPRHPAWAFIAGPLLFWALFYAALTSEPAAVGRPGFLAMSGAIVGALALAVAWLAHRRALSRL